MKIAIVDDEKIFRDKEKKLIAEKYDYDIYSYESTKELLESKITFNLILLDIGMPDNGIEFARTHMAKFPYIIFVTSYKEHYAKAYNPNVVGFIEKVHMHETLVKKIDEVKERLLKESLITFKTKSGSVNVLNKSINYFSVEYNCYYVVTDKHILIQLSSFKEIKKYLSNDFYQINRSQIVKLSNIQNIYKSTHTIEMSNGDVLAVSNRKWKGLKESYVKVMNYVGITV